MKNKRSFTEKLPLILAFVLPILIMFGIFIGKQFWPFGDNCFLRTDLYHQYVAFYEDLGDRLRQGKSLLYAFDIGLGSNYPALFAYYLSGPFNMLVFLVPTEYVIEFITIMIVLKIGMCGWAMAWYLSKRFNTRHFGIVFCGVCYALSGYLAAYSWNIMWLDVLWLSVIAIYGLELLIKENKPFLYCVSLALAILCNYYISIMLCIFMVLYFINRLIAVPNLSARQILGRCASFAGFSLLAGAIAAVLVVPAAYALQGTASAGSTFPKTLTNYFSVIDMLARHLLVVNVETGLDHWPNIYSGVMVFMLVPLYYMNKKVLFREKIANTILIGFMLLSFNTNMLNFIWHGFHYPNSLPCRQSFLYTFIIMVMCFEGIRNIRQVTKEQLVRVMWGAIAAILVVEVITDSNEIPYYACYASIAVIALYTLFVYLWKVRKLEYGTMIALCLCLLILENGLNTAVTSVTTVSRSYFMRWNDSIDQLVAEAEEGKDFTRIERQFIRTKNDGVYLGYNSASIFSSTTNKAISDFYRKAGLEGNTNAYAITGATPFMWSFLHIEYMLTDARLPSSPLYEFVDMKEDRMGGYNFLYHNLYTLPLGYLVPEDLNRLWSPNASSPVRTQNSYVNLAAGVNNILDTVKTSNSGTVLSYVADKPGFYCAYVGSSTVRKVTASVNGGTGRIWDSLDRNYLVNFGYLLEGDELRMSASDVNTMSATLFRLNEENFIQAYENLSAHPYNITEFTDKTFKTQISGTVDADKESLLVFSIPIDNGWNIKVDGKNADVIALGSAFLSVRVEPGHHEVVLTYVPEGLPTGILLSLAGLAVLLICLAVSLIVKASRKNPSGELPEAPAEPEEVFPGADDYKDIPVIVPDTSPVPPATQQAQAPKTGRERIAAMHQFDEEERVRDLGRMPVIAFDGGTAYPRFVSPAERQRDEALLLLAEEEQAAAISEEEETADQEAAAAGAQEESADAAETEAAEAAETAGKTESAETASSPSEEEDSVLDRKIRELEDLTSEVFTDQNQDLSNKDEAYLASLEDLLKRTEDSISEVEAIIEEKKAPGDGQ